MSCVLRVDGCDLDVDRLIEAIGIPVSAVYRRGEPRRIAVTGGVCEKSGFNLCVSDAGFDAFDQQVTDVIESLREDADLYAMIRNFPGVEDMLLDFGRRWKDTFTHTDCLPADLIRLAGGFGMEIAISHYPISDDSDADACCAPSSG